MDNNNETSTEKVGGEIPVTGTSSTNETERFERAYNIFNSSIKRAENLLNINLDASKNTLSITEDKLLDSYRAVIVLSISALDAYIKTFVIVEIKQCLESRNLSNNLKQYIKAELFTKEALHQHVLENNFYEKVVERFEEDFEKRSFQGQESINKFMKLAGFTEVFKQISKSADKSVDNLLSDLERFTQRRHNIVHCGDHDLNQTTPTENQINQSDASDCVKLVSLIANEIHKISQSK